MPTVSQLRDPQFRRAVQSAVRQSQKWNVTRVVVRATNGRYYTSAPELKLTGDEEIMATINKPGQS